MSFITIFYVSFLFIHSSTHAPIYAATSWRFEEFSSQPNRSGPDRVRRRPRRRATCTFRVILLNSGLQRYTCPRGVMFLYIQILIIWTFLLLHVCTHQSRVWYFADGSHIQRLVVERDQTEREFLDALKSLFLQLGENFKLCKEDVLYLC